MRRFPQDLTDLLLAPLNQQINNPSGIWADYNCLYNSRLAVKSQTKEPPGLTFFCQADVPTEPQINDYPDIENPTTIECACPTCSGCPSWVSMRN